MPSSQPSLPPVSVSFCSDNIGYQLELTASIANSVAAGIPPPQRRGRCAAILACNHHCLVLPQNGWYVRVIPFAPTHSRLLLDNVQLSAFRDPVVICRTPTAFFGTTRSVTPAASRACSGWHFVGGDIGCSGSRAVATHFRGSFLHHHLGASTT